MKLCIEVEANEKVDNLTMASTIISFCKNFIDLDPVKIAKHILVEKERDPDAK